VPGSYEIWYLLVGIAYYPMAANDAYCPCRKEFMGDCVKEQSFKLLDIFYDLGGIFIVTSVWPFVTKHRL
jgi:hypothetical protein